MNGIEERLRRIKAELRRYERKGGAKPAVRMGEVVCLEPSRNSADIFECEGLVRAWQE